MKVSKTPFKDLLVVETDLFEDNRGWFTETYSKDKFCEQGIDADFLQDNHSYSAKKNTLRGIHFQINPKAQAKLVRCTRGAILDVAVDLRKGSDTYKKWFGIELSAKNKKQLFMPKGFGHAFLTLTDDVEVQYKVDEYYSKEHDRSIRFDDPELAIDWNVKNPILSEKDQKASLLKDSDANFSIKVLVTGANGQLGQDVLKRLRQLGIEGIGATRKDFDISNEDQTMKFILRHKPDVVVHCAAYTAVERAEEEREKCYAVNVEGTKNIAKACKKIDAKMLYVSTDYVFSGEGVMPHKEDDPISPINYYGYTKKLGEDIVKNMLEKFFIIRTSWLYGKKGKNFVKTMLETAQTQSEMNVVSDQIGSPTYAKDLAVLICDIIQTDKFGIYHGTNEGYCSWYEFAKAIFDKKGIHVKLNPITSDQYPTKAKRPLNSRLSKEKLDEAGFKRLPHWEDALERYLKEQRLCEQ
jgi:dTDP-4-dehydrorhamnose reductase/dTDP-4-dehydrorhamnose 3,5-epimerase